MLPLKTRNCKFWISFIDCTLSFENLLFLFKNYFIFQYLKCVITFRSCLFSRGSISSYSEVEEEVPSNENEKSGKYFCNNESSC